MDSINIIGLDKFVSIWVIIYSWAYIVGIFNYNPIILSTIITIYVLITAIVILYYQNANTNLLYYLLTNLSIKLPPLYFLYYIINKRIRYIDVIFSCIFVLSYILYMKIINEDIYNVYKDYNTSIIDENKGRSEPLFPIYKYYRDKYIKNK